MEETRNVQIIFLRPLEFLARLEEEIEPDYVLQDLGDLMNVL